MEQERRHSGRLAESFDTANEDGVVAASMGDFVGYFETGAAAWQQRRPASAGMPVQSGEAVDRPRSEAVGEIELAGRQNIDGMVAGAAEGGEVVRGIVKAPEHQGRIQRHRRK